jgi:hypothetical protein
LIEVENVHTAFRRAVESTNTQDLVLVEDLNRVLLEELNEQQGKLIVKKENLIKAYDEIINKTGSTNK